MEKKKFFILSAMLFIASIFLAGCDEERQMQARASLHLVKVDNKGVSYIEEEDQARVGWNVAMLVSEGFATGGGNKVHSSPITSLNDLYMREPSFNGDHAAFSDAKEEHKGNWYLSEQLEFVNKSSKAVSGAFKEKISLNYLQVPVLINYSIPLMHDNSVHFGFGPYAAAGLFGHFKGDGVKRKVNFGSSADNDDLKRMDYGLHVDAGYRFMKKWDATLGYEFGLRNLSTTSPDPDTKIKGFGLYIGYWFK